MNSLWLWIGIAIVVIVLIVVFIAIGKKRGESKKVSFEKPKEEEPKQLTQEQKSGNYQAKSPFNSICLHIPFIRLISDIMSSQ